MLHLQDLGCRKERQTLFSDVNCQLQPGELLHVAGENGSGKTTLLRIVAGLNRDHDGSVLWQGRDIRQCWPDYAAQLLYLGHQPALKAQLNPVENLEWFAAAAGIGREAILPALDALGVAHCAKLACHQLSAGQQRRVALARLLFSRQKSLWLLDEPFTALDIAGVQRVMAALRDQLAAGGCVLLTTHHGMETSGLPHQTLWLGTTASGRDAA